MSETKKPSEFPLVSSTSESLQGLVLSGSSFARMPYTHLIARMLMPFANLYVRISNSYTRTAWLEFSSSETYWGMKGMAVGDVLVITGTTSDTGQKFAYYFLAERAKTVTDMYGHCFLFLLEGEPPVWPTVT